ncbi:hypothetical protein [Clostridium algidicarnis]|uniref:Uncharacterized protein n=1 Tax=Clostridium algidicarnis TaxID=37659 RepID=A0ABS6C6D6_9CLOT|nr:hypothetical protein [Clostridium algidicarnis]MBU3221051.1 hypothetical protein [Clostridium algidicarnis]
MIDKIGMNLNVNEVNSNKTISEGNRNKNINEINSKVKEQQSMNYKDTIELSTKLDYNYAQDRKNWVSNGKGGLTPTLKGMVQVSAGAFNKIQTASLVPPLSDHLMEMGKDENCRWVVIDGVRYETPLSKSEKEMKHKTLIELLFENDKRMEERKVKEKYYEKSEIIDLGDSKAMSYGNLPTEALDMLAGIFNKAEGDTDIGNI